jgi:hypothetical protein
MKNQWKVTILHITPFFEPVMQKESVVEQEVQ